MQELFRLQKLSFEIRLQRSIQSLPINCDTVYRSSPAFEEEQTRIAGKKLEVLQHLFVN